jgi:predicted dehydrogenase
MAVRVGVIGAGAYAQRAHLPSLGKHPDVELRAVCRRNPDRLTEVAETFGIPNTYASYSDLIQNEALDAVTISLPHHLHYQAVGEALESGLHVLVDKPMALRLDHAEELVELGSSLGLVLMVAFNRRYEPPFVKARELVNDGLLGNLRLIDAHMAYDWDLWSKSSETRFTGAAAKMLDGVSKTQAALLSETTFRSDPSSNGGGFFADGGPHAVDACLWLAGSRATSVFAQMDSSTDDLYTTLTMRLESGVLCSLVCVGDSPVPRDFGFHIYGETGAIHMRWNELVLERELHDRTSFNNASMASPDSPTANFIDTIMGRAKPIVTAQDGLNQVAVTEAAYRSTQSSTPIEC